MNPYQPNEAIPANNHPLDDRNRTSSIIGLSQTSLATLVTASMIGAGVFTTSGFAIGDLRDPWLVMFAWVIGGIIAICGALSYGQLARILTDNGGEYLFLSRFVHPVAGFVAGWVSFLAGFSGAGAFAAIAFETYALPETARPPWLPAGSIAISLVFLSTIVHMRHTSRGAITQNWLVGAKLLCIGVFLVWSLISFDQWRGGGSVAGPSGSVGIFEIATSVMWISLSYCGFNAAIYMAGEASGGWRDVAGAMTKAVIAVTLIYLLLNAVFLFGPEPDQIAGQKDVATLAAQSIGGTLLASFVRLAICLGLASSVSATVMTGPRVYAKMASDGVFPAWFDDPHSPPRPSILLQSAVIVIIIVVSSLQNLLTYLSLTLSLCSAATVAILFSTVRQKFVVTTFNQFVATLYVAATLVIAGLSAWHRPQTVIATLLTFASGVALYQLMSRKRGR